MIYPVDTVIHAKNNYGLETDWGVTGNRKKQRVEKERMEMEEAE